MRHAGAVRGNPFAELACLYDPRPAAVDAARERFGGVAVGHFSEFKRRVDAVIIASPAATHCSIASWFLENRIPTFIEKPACLSMPEYRLLAEIARRNATPTFVGMLERHNSAVDRLVDLIDGEKIRSINAVRASPASIRIQDASVVEDLMIHDIDLLFHRFRLPVAFDSIHGFSTGEGRGPDHADACAVDPSGAYVSLHSSRVTQFHARRIEVNLAAKTIRVDLASQRIWACSSGCDPSGRYFREDERSERFAEPLDRQLSRFVSVLTSGSENAHDLDSVRTTMATTFDLVDRFRQADGRTPASSRAQVAASESAGEDGR
jgi:predicted dehydrogenase